MAEKGVEEQVLAMERLQIVPCLHLLRTHFIGFDFLTSGRYT